MATVDLAGYRVFCFGWKVVKGRVEAVSVLVVWIADNTDDTNATRGNAFEGYNEGVPVVEEWEVR